MQIVYESTSIALESDELEYEVYFLLSITYV